MPKFKQGWTDNPTPPGRRDRPLKPMDGIPAYRRKSDGGVGEPIPAHDANSPYVALLKDGVGVDPDQPAAGPDGAYLVLAELPQGEPVWLVRSYLADPHYELTTKKIEARAAEDELKMRETFWRERRESYRAVQTITVKQPMVAKDFLDEPYDLKPGTYPLFTVADATASDAQETPFSLMITVDGQTVTVNPDLLEVEESHVEEAKQKQLDIPVSAERIKKVFAAAPDVVRRHIKNEEWLADGQIHYLTSQQMGAVFVLSRMPKGEADIGNAKRKNPALFLQGANSPGVRLGRDIFVQESERGTGVEFHEAVHLLSGSRRGLLDVFGQDFNEGVTEFFTRLAVAQPVERGEIVRSDDAYLVQRLGVEALLQARLFSQDQLAAAYFDGDLQPLFAGTARAMEERPFSLQGYAARLNSKYSFAARGVLEEVLAGPT